MGYNPLMYKKKLLGVLTGTEKQLLARLNSPQEIQDYLDSLPVNYEVHGETYMSPRRMIAAKTAHCFEGALFAAAALAYHGHKPLLLDIQTIPRDEDHVVALFRQHGHWGAISKTNHAILRYRDPIYKTVRELAMSYAHEYMMENGVKSMRAYSAPFDLSQYTPEEWVTEKEDLGWLVNHLDESRHFPIAPKKNIRLLRKGSKVELQALTHVEWPEPRKKKH